MLLTGLSRECLLLSAVLKHKVLQKLVHLHRNKSRASRLWDSVRCGKVVDSIIVVGLVFVY